MKKLNRNLVLNKFGIFIAIAFLVLHTIPTFAQTETDSIPKVKKYQAKPPATQPFGAEAFGPSDKTTLRWLGMAGCFINSRGTTMMVDPLLKGFDMPIMIDFPIKTEDVPIWMQF